MGIEELGADEVKVEKDEDAEVLIPENPEDVPAVPLAPVNAAAGDNAEPEVEEIPRSPPPSANPSALNLQSENDDDDIDETMFERLVGLTEMFPEALTKGTVDL